MKAVLADLRFEELITAHGPEIVVLESFGSGVGTGYSWRAGIVLGRFAGIGASLSGEAFRSSSYEVSADENEVNAMGRILYYPVVLILLAGMFLIWGFDALKFDPEYPQYDDGHSDL